MTNLLESCRVAPPPHTVAEQSLPLNLLDLIWLPFPPVRRLLFYDLPDSSKPYFLESIVPKLKESLSLTLKHFFPLSGTILYPSNPHKKPEIRFRAGDSVSLTFFESSEDFDFLVGNQAQDADKFYDLMPQLSQITVEESDQKLLEVFAIRVTLFSGRGLCIGLSTHHCLGDGSSMVGFIESWASINKEGGEKEFLVSESSPVFDRALVKYSPELDSVFQNKIRKIPISSPRFALPTGRVRATYIFTRSEIKNLKDSVLTRFPDLGHVSSFVVIAAYVWNCLAKAMIAYENEKEIVDDEFFSFAVNARDRIDPPVPGNYFGNCLGFGLAKLPHSELVGKEGFFVAVEAISDEIKNRVANIFGGAENWRTKKNRVLSVSGSVGVDLYGTDFGWGRGRKIEALSIDGKRYSMSLCKSRDFEGGFEIGMSLPNVNMDAFGALFSHGLLRGNKCGGVVSRL